MPHVLDIDLRFAVRGLLNGGLEMGVQSVLGGTTVWHCEIEPAPARVLAHHHPDTPNLGDIATVDWSSVEPVDVLTGGSPCQDVSHAGMRAGMRAGTRSGLWASMCDAIDIIRPRLVVWENVRGALSAGADSAVEPCPLGMGHGEGVSLRAAGRVVGDLAELGYDSWWCGLRAADAGAPHGRYRVFVFAWPADSESVPWGVEHGDDVRAGWSAGRHRPPAGRGTAADAGSVGWDRGPGVGGVGRGQGVRGEEGCHPGDVHRAPSVAADPDSIGPRGTGDSRRRGDGPAHSGVAAAHADVAGQQRPDPADDSPTTPGHRKDAHPGGSVALRRRGAAAHPESDGRHEGRTEPARQLGRPDAAQRGDAAAADPDGQRHGRRADGRGLGRLDGADEVQTPQRERAREVTGDRSAEVAWGAVEPAIRRWEHLTRPAPPPTEPNWLAWWQARARRALSTAPIGHRGSVLPLLAAPRRRLSPAFVEWLMGLPAGWVTDPAIGLTRNEQLKALGNGVVPQQAALSTRLWLDAMERPVAA